MSCYPLKISLFLALSLAISANAMVPFQSCRFGLIAHEAIRELASHKVLSQEQQAYINTVLDEVHVPRRNNEFKTRRALDSYRNDPASNDTTNSEIQKSMSGYWTLNAMNYLLADSGLSAEQRANVFQHFADEITRRTQQWNEPWKMVAIKNQRGDYTFLGALHCVVILNEPNGRVFKGHRRYSDAKGSITNPDKYFGTWDPRDAINQDIFLATKSDAK